MPPRDRYTSPRFAAAAIRPSSRASKTPASRPCPEAVVHSGPGADLLRHLPPLPTGLEPPDHTLELLPEPLGVRAVLTDRQVRPDELPLRVRQLHTRHARRSTGPDPAARANPTD